MLDGVLLGSTVARSPHPAIIGRRESARSHRKINISTIGGVFPSDKKRESVRERQTTRSQSATRLGFTISIPIGSQQLRYCRRAAQRRKSSRRCNKTGGG